MPTLPRLPALALADQLEVVAHDLFTVLDDNDVLAGPLLAELLLHRWHIDGSPPGPSATELAARATGASGLEEWQRLCQGRLPA